ncbi:expressed unknown protein [Seminavis robusta]|uniref:Uncharacterized protein n=1 Tax=Seminavis robusta TaxID=568900 RepID=A0A9N8EF03_9STRA|nr:expressed unknown protein [Seminavis robusta]|eukprot:Sro981_g227510.1 n/a (283) ;mRNA; r:11877-12725
MMPKETQSATAKDKDEHHAEELDPLKLVELRLSAQAASEHVANNVKQELETTSHVKRPDRSREHRANNTAKTGTFIMTDAKSGTNESSFHLLKVVEARAREAKMNPQEVQQSTIDTEKGQGNHQGGEIVPSPAANQRAVNRSIRPGAYAGAPGSSFHRMLTLRFSLLGRGRSGMATMKFFKSKNDGLDGTGTSSSGLDGSGLSVAVPVAEPSIQNLPTAERLGTVSQRDRDAQETEFRRQNENLKATLKLVVPGLLMILMVVLLIVFLAPDTDQITVQQGTP